METSVIRWLGSASLVLTLAVPASAQSVRISVIDRGQADGIVIRTPYEQWVVIDGGTNAQQAELMERWGITTVALVVGSHRHFDHNGGMDDILERFTIQRFIGNLEDCPGNVQDDKVRGVLAARAIPRETPANQTMTIDGVTFTILPTDPVDDACPSEENDNSVVVRLDFGEFSMLFPGDAETQEMEWLLDHHRELLDVDVLKASHHGADNGVSDSLLAAVTPERVVISAGVNGTFRHPRPEAVAAYIAATGGASRVRCTNRHMTVTVFGSADGRIRVTRQNPIDKSCVFDGTHY